jgi:c-di-GMP-binding flagellar brake protein YcgR
VEITGRIVHSRTNDDGKHEVGIEFLKINATARKVLKQFIDAFQLKGD